MKRSAPLRSFFRIAQPAAFTLLAAGLLLAHPMGNFSISHYAKFEPSGERITLTYALDLAEVPTFELLRDWKMERTSPAPELQQQALRQAREWVGNLNLTVDGKPVKATVRSADLVFADGAGGLPVLRITAKAELPASPGRLEYEDRNFADRAGWKEIVVATGTAIVERPSHSSKDISNALTAYPEDPTIAPPQDLRARFDWKPFPVVASTPAADAPVPAVRVEPIPQPKPSMSQAQPSQSPAAPVTTPGTVQKGDFLSELLRKGDLSLGMILMGLVAAFGFGAMHALSPGHGKTIVAAYLVGSRGTMKHAMLLGGMVTLTHTASVFALGLGTLFLSRYVVPDKIIPVLSVVSGLMIVFVGASMFYRRLQQAVATHDHHSHDHHHGHSHDHGHSHSYDHAHEPEHAMAGAAMMHSHAHHSHDHGHDHHGHDHHGHDHHGHDHHSHDHHAHDHHHGPGGHTHYIEGEVTMGSLMGLAVSGGLVPCPSALVLLLSAIALGRIGLGLALLTSFSLGLSVVLIVIGCMVLYAKHLLPDRSSLSNHGLVKMMPVISAGVITVVGLVMTAVALGWVRPAWS
ncbi:MAG: hypothetical protein JNL98_24115 [Bryobacterales bacterium]|nr:hypothetical protein [Bryobacterales bacterium]